MTKTVPIASIAFLLAFTIATGAAEAGPGSLANRGQGGPGAHGMQLPAGGPGGPANRGPGLAGQQDGGPLAGAKKDGPAAKFGNRTNGGGNTYNGGAASGTATGTYAGGNAATVSGNTVSGNTTGSNNTVNVTGNQATGYGNPYAAPVVVVPTSSAKPASTATATASCPSGTAMQSITTNAQGQTTVVCVTASK